MNSLGIKSGAPPINGSIERYALVNRIAEWAESESLKKSERTSLLLVKAAAAAMIDKYPKSISVSDVIKRAGSARGTFYIYFSDVKAIELAVMEKALDLREDLIPFPSDYEDLYQGVQAYVLEYCRYYAANAGLIKVLTTRINTDDDFSALREQRNYSLVSRLLKALREKAPELDTDASAVELAAWSMLGMMEYTLSVLYGSGVSPRRRELAGSLEGAADVLALLVYRGLFGKAPVGKVFSEKPGLEELLKL